jgi:predicted transcriptional regulator of viral defense system
MTIPKLVRTFWPQRLFTFDEAVRAQPQTSRAAIRVHLSRLVKSGHLARLRRGLYAVAEPDRPGQPPLLDPVVVAQKVDPHAVAAFHTALALWGVARSEADDVWVKTPKYASAYEVAGHVVRPTKASPHELVTGMTTMRRDGVPVRVTDKEHTLLDAMGHPEKCGGTTEVLQSLANIEFLDLPHLMAMARTRNRVVHQRLGFTLERFQKKWRVPDGVLEDVWARAAKSPGYFGAEAKGGRYDPRWKLVVPKDLGDEVK